MTHTKGPWRIRVNNDDDQETCDMSILGDIFVLANMKGPQYPHQKANALLIAAAPDLLEFALEFKKLRVVAGAMAFDNETLEATW